MYLSAPTNWDDNLIAEISQINSSHESIIKVGQVYGAVRTKIGDGRMETPDLPESRVRRHIQLVHQIGLPFNFLLNAPSMGGLEHDRAYRPKLVRTLRWVASLNVDLITVANPFLGELIQHHCPSVKIKMSTITDVSSIQAVNLLQRLGPSIDAVTLSYNVNREFQLLREIVDSLSVEVELLANIICLLNCPFQWYHYDLVGSYSSVGRGYSLPFDDYRPLACDLVRLESIGEIVRTPWIRPEDVSLYADMGITSIKIAGRTSPTSEIVRRMTAYSRCSHDGNLWNLIAPWMPIRVPNDSLNGFIDFFVNKDFVCAHTCGKCNYCDKVAAECVELESRASAYIADVRERLVARLSTSVVPGGPEFSPEAFFQNGSDKGIE